MSNRDDLQELIVLLLLVIIVKVSHGFVAFAWGAVALLWLARPWLDRWHGKRRSKRRS